MYDLLILGMLMAHDYSGYKLGHVLGEVLVPRRKLSNGVMYPVLERLETDGYLVAHEQTLNGRHTKMMHITQSGCDRFYELMAKPVVQDAKRDDIYRFKFRGFGQIDDRAKADILAAYEQSQQEDLSHYLQAQDKLQHDMAEYHDNTEHYRWALNTIDLQVQSAKAHLAWVDEMKKELDIKE